MATVFMKWLENSPKDYDRGIQILTLGWLDTRSHPPGGGFSRLRALHCLRGLRVAMSRRRYQVRIISTCLI